MVGLLVRVYLCSINWYCFMLFVSFFFVLFSFFVGYKAASVMSGMRSSFRGGGGGWRVPSIWINYQQAYSPMDALNSEIGRRGSGTPNNTTKSDHCVVFMLHTFKRTRQVRRRVADLWVYVLQKRVLMRMDEGEERKSCWCIPSTSG